MEIEDKNIKLQIVIFILLYYSGIQQDKIDSERLLAVIIEAHMEF